MISNQVKRCDISDDDDVIAAGTPISSLVIWCPLKWQELWALTYVACWFRHSGPSVSHKGSDRMLKEFKILIIFRSNVRVCQEVKWNINCVCLFVQAGKGVSNPHHFCSTQVTIQLIVPFRATTPKIKDKNICERWSHLYVIVFN